MKLYKHEIFASILYMPMANNMLFNVKIIHFEKVQKVSHVKHKIYDDISPKVMQPAKEAEINCQILYYLHIKPPSNSVCMKVFIVKTRRPIRPA